MIWYNGNHENDYDNCSRRHDVLTYTLSKNAETGAITVTYSEPQGFPFHFHWTATVSIDGTTTTTPMVVERQ